MYDPVDRYTLLCTPGSSQSLTQAHTHTHTNTHMHMHAYTHSKRVLSINFMKLIASHIIVNTIMDLVVV